MKKLLLAAAIVAFASASMAQNVKIGVVDLAKVQEKSAVFKKFAKRRDDMMETLRKESEKAEQELAAAQKKLMDERTKLSEADFNKKAAEFGEKLKSTQESLMGKSRNMEEKAKKEFTELAEGKLQPIIKTVSKNENLNLVVTSAAVLHNDSAMDITDQVIKQLDSGK